MGKDKHEWTYDELAQYVNASKRPAGEALSVTASNFMLMMDRDRNSSITLNELEDFLQERRDVQGLNGEAGNARAAERQRKMDAELEEVRKRQPAGASKPIIFGKDVDRETADAEQFLMGLHHPELVKAEKAAPRRKHGAEGATQKRRKAKSRKRRKEAASKDEV